MDNNRSKTKSAYILAGGKSLRMGEDKGLKLLNNKSMITYILQVLSPYFSSIKINTSNPLYSQFGYELISDLIPGKGPLGGIYSSLQDTPEKEIFIISCDIPLMSSKFLEIFLNKYKNTYLVNIPSYKGALQPLVGIYSKDNLELMRNCIDNNDLKMHSYLEKIKTNIIEVDKHFDYDIFMNINTIKEFNRLKNYLNEN